MVVPLHKMPSKLLRDRLEAWVVDAVLLRHVLVNLLNVFDIRVCPRHFLDLRQ